MKQTNGENVVHVSYTGMIDDKNLEEYLLYL